MIKQRQPASSKNGNFVITVDGSHLGKNPLGSTATSWTRMTMDMYPPGSSVRYAILSKVFLKYSCWQCLTRAAVDHVLIKTCL